MSQLRPNVIVVGSGLSALLTANYLSEHMNVMIFTKLRKADNNSFLAQGGVAGAVAATDNWQLHYDDTLLAGCNHNNKKAVEMLTKLGPIQLQDFIEKGMKFDRNRRGQLSLGMEGAHSERRILHAGGDQTGKELMKWLESQLSPSVTVVEHETVIKLLVEGGQCFGVQTCNPKGDKLEFLASHVVLATGGAGGLYSYTTNNNSVTGMALSIAHLAGAALTDLEFMQFHPTMLHVNGSAVGLISEAVRGEGAYLQNSEGVRFMKGIHPLTDLAPRDVVSRAIYQEMESGRTVFLNIEQVIHFEQRFPTITRMCQNNGIDLTKKLLPVVPGAHFFMGGIQTNLYGETTLPGLYAVGEAACNGVHGANRLASNSLLEGIVFSKSLATNLIRNHAAAGPSFSLGNGFSKRKKEKKHISLPTSSTLKSQMMKYAGIVRNKTGLKTLINWLEPFKPYWEELENTTENMTLDEIEMIHMLHLSYLMANSAINREESRGAHYRSDFPFIREEWNGKRILHKEREKVGL